MRARVTPAVALLAVALSYLGTQLMLFDESRYLDFDEAVYLSQVTPNKAALTFSAHRARGITWLLIPASWSHATLPQIRIYLAVISASMLAGAFSIWLPLLGWATPLAAAFYGFTWVALFYGSEIMPNHFLALLVVGVAGSLARSFTASGWRWLVLSALITAAAAAIRPTDAAAMAFGLGLATLVVALKKRFRTLLALGLGLLVGWVPWFYEAFTQFEGPIRRYQDAARLHSALNMNIFRHLSVTGGELLGTLPTIPLGGALWWVGLAGFSMSAFRQVNGRDALRTLSLVTIGGVITSGPYFFLTRGVQEHLLAPVIAPRFLLPAYALIGIAAAVGVRGYLLIPRGSKLHRFTKAGATLLFLGAGAAWHLRVADQVAVEQFGLRERPRLVGSALQSLAHGDPCVFASNFPSPDIEFASDCRWQRFPLALAATAQALEDLANETSRVFVVSRAGSAQSKLFLSWRPTPIDGTTGWIVFEPPRADQEPHKKQRPAEAGR